MQKKTQVFDFISERKGLETRFACAFARISTNVKVTKTIKEATPYLRPVALAISILQLPSAAHHKQASGRQSIIQIQRVVIMFLQASIQNPNVLLIVISEGDMTFLLFPIRRG